MIAARRVVVVLSLLLSLLVAAPGCRTDAPIVARPIALSAPTADEISVEQLALLLPKHPIVVGFDVDDTLIFSAPAFNALQPSYSADVIRPKSYDALTVEERRHYHEFWNKLNDKFDDESTPKLIGKRLLDLHLSRGDDVWIISKRQTSEHGDACTRRYERMFGVKLPHAVEQTQLRDKTPFIARHRIEYYYGDSDSDIASALTAGAVPIRVKRSDASYAKDQVHNGQLGEIVLKDSDR